MLHPVDAIKNPINSRDPIYRVYKKLYNHKNRYAVGENIFIICFYHYENGNKSYNDINYYIERCNEKTISNEDIKYEFETITVVDKFICFFGVDGYLGVLKTNRKIQLTNDIPYISIYHEAFPKVYHEWSLRIGKVKKSFVDYRYVLEIAKTKSYRFRKVALAIKKYKPNMYRL